LTYYVKSLLWKKGEYLLIEFETADDVIFKRNGAKATPALDTRFPPVRDIPLCRFDLD
jgi:hypothetical protein